MLDCVSIKKYLQKHFYCDSLTHPTHTLYYLQYSQFVVIKRDILLCKLMQ